MYPTGQNKLYINTLKLFTKSKRKRNTKDYFSVWEQRAHAGSLSLPPVLDSLLLVMTQSVPVVFWGAGLPMLHRHFYWSPHHSCSLCQIHQEKRNNYRHCSFGFFLFCPSPCIRTPNRPLSWSNQSLTKTLLLPGHFSSHCSQGYFWERESELDFHLLQKGKNDHLKTLWFYFYPVPMQDSSVGPQHCRDYLSEASLS